MNNEIANIEFELPGDICGKVYLITVLVTALFGWFYDFWGIGIAVLGGLAGAWVWCKYMRKIFALPTRSTAAIYASGVLLGAAVGMADGVLLHVIGMNLQKAGVVTIGDFSPLGPRNYMDAITVGASWGAFAGLANGMLWGGRISLLHEKAWLYLQGVAQDVSVNEYDYDDITRVVKVTKGAGDEQ